jgi:hypothetical protein
MNPQDNSETGEPIEILKEQELETSARFLTQVRGKIYRRTATSQVVTYSWKLPGVSLLELARLLSYLLRSFGSSKEFKQ